MNSVYNNAMILRYCALLNNYKKKRSDEMGEKERLLGGSRGFDADNGGQEQTHAADVGGGQGAEVGSTAAEEMEEEAIVATGAARANYCAGRRYDWGCREYPPAKRSR